MPHIVGKISTRATTLLYTSFQLEVFTQNYGHLKLWKSQFKELKNFNLGVPGQNDIWVLALWPCTKNTTRGKVVASPKSEPWWVLLVHVCLWFVRAPIMFQLCTNQLVIWFVQACVNNWPISHSSLSHFGAPTRPSTLEVLQARERAITLCPFDVFTL